MAKVLFILKYREDKWGGYGEYLSSGLFNSAGFVCDMLNKNGVESKLVHVIDNNFIDREVAAYKPTHVIIEAYWVVPEKFEILQKLHPTVTWIIRNHSELPFLGSEGIGIQWSIQYVAYKNVFLSCNSHRANLEMKTIISQAYPAWTESEVNAKVVYLPNYYPVSEPNNFNKIPSNEVINVGCFGAIRPLKNHLLQAVAALKYASENNLLLNFHINSTRIELQGNPVLKNLREMFALMPQHQLIEHSWMPHKEFKELLSTMDLSLQVSFTESFNIVAADSIDVNVPTVVSEEISWMDSDCFANPTNSDSIKRAIYRVLSLHHSWRKWFCWSRDNSRTRLKVYDKKSTYTWLRYLNK